MAFFYVILVIDVADTEIGLEIDKVNYLWKLTECQNRIVKLKEKQRDIEKIKEENKMLNGIFSHASKHSKATVENINRIRELKEEGKSYRAIAKELSEATGQENAHSTVRYLIVGKLPLCLTKVCKLWVAHSL